MEIDELKDRIREIQNRPKYKKVVCLIILGVICIIGGFLSAILYNIIAQNEPGTWTFPIISAIVMFIGAGLAIIYSFMEPYMFPELRRLKIEYKIEKIKERKGLI
jgi:formate hydrogenlyase subunit 3/multisubunit Na+/H+ antiporter MnhD subunit